MAKDSLTPENFEKLENFIKENSGETDGIMPILHEAQKLFGYIPLDVQKFISERTGISISRIHGVVTFYSQFSTEPKGDYVVGVCLGTACYVKGAQAILDKFKSELGIGPDETTEDGKFTLVATRCIGACGLAPVITVNEDVYGKLDAKEVPNILKKYN
ncbi:MAG TPA: NAD(P)H-dependent oxidoreductase subunit E [Firmicutes bacterium]|nr:NAD(P)H-dependent oxidoreductase subunit E [Bacillota bacterium]